MTTFGKFVLRHTAARARTSPNMGYLVPFALVSVAVTGVPRLSLPLSILRRRETPPHLCCEAVRKLGNSQDGWVLSSSHQLDSRAAKTVSFSCRKSSGCCRGENFNERSDCGISGSCTKLEQSYSSDLKTFSIRLFVDSALINCITICLSSSFRSSMSFICFMSVLSCS